MSVKPPTASNSLVALLADNSITEKSISTVNFLPDAGVGHIALPHFEDTTSRDRWPFRWPKQRKELKLNFEEKRFAADLPDRDFFD